MILLIDIGNTHTHAGLAGSRGIVKRGEFSTADWRRARNDAALQKFAGKRRIDGAAICSVAPWATPFVKRSVSSAFQTDCFELKPERLIGVGIDYPAPETIGPDRLANALGVKMKYGAPAIVVDFGTAVTFDVVNGAGDYVGGVIAPGLAAMTDYLHEKTALLPSIKIREPRDVIGKSTEEAMLIGAVVGYRGLIRGVIIELRKELKAPRAPVIATGGCAKLIAANMAEVASVDPDLTLTGLWMAFENFRKQ